MKSIINYNSCIRNYYELLKPGVILLVVFTSAVGLFMAPGFLDPINACVSVLCVALGSGGASSINMWYDRDIDVIMARTRFRPIPRGDVTAGVALLFGVILSMLSIIIMTVFVNFLAAFLLFAAIIVYVVIYTMWLKRYTVQNIVIGGAVGIFPPVIGWVSVTNTIDINSIILGGIIFFWNPPHFWSLSLFKSKDYKLVNIPMLPIIYGDFTTKIHILLYSLILVIFSIMPYFTGMSGVVYTVVALILDIILLYYVFLLFYCKNYLNISKELFLYSIIYLFVLFLSLVVDRIIFLI